MIAPLPNSSDGANRPELSVPASTPVNSVLSADDSDAEPEAGDFVNASVSCELASILSRAAALIETQQHSTENFTNGSAPISTRSVSGQVSTNGVSRELSLSQLSGYSGVQDVPGSSNITRSVAGRGRIQRRRSVAALGRRQSSTTQDGSLSLSSTAADLHK